MDGKDGKGKYLLALYDTPIVYFAEAWIGKPFV
jgi:hypothetical protein